MAKAGRLRPSTEALKEFLRESQIPEELYHGTTRDIQEFTSSPIWLTQDPRAASEFANRKAFGEREVPEHEEDYRSEDQYAPKFDVVASSGQNVMPLHASIKKPLDLRDIGPTASLEEMAGRLADEGIIEYPDKDILDEIAMDLGDEDHTYDSESLMPTYRTLEALDAMREIEQKGYDGLAIVDTDVHGYPIDAWAAFKPGQVKSSIANVGSYDPSTPNISKAKGGKIKPLHALRETVRELPEFKNWFEGSKVVDEEGKPLPVFHGSSRLDRFQEGIKKERATSGPMPFFTGDPEIASNYATGKSDTSLEDTGYEHWFTYKPKGSRTEQPLARMWYDMTPQQRADFNARMRNIGVNEDTGAIEDQGPGGGVAPSHWDWLVSGQNEHRGNGLSAAVDMWLQSANLFDEEHKFLDALRLAGLDTSKVKFTDFKHGAPGVLPAFISAKNPLVTSDIPPHVVEALEDAAPASRPESEFMRGVDPWDKAFRDPQVWLDELKKGIEEAKAGGNPGHAWTSIPDWVTETLQSLGYDSIHDVGGKMGGAEHDVWIPFEPTQIKSPFNKGTFDPKKKDIMKAKGGRINPIHGYGKAVKALPRIKANAATIPQSAALLEQLKKASPEELAAHFGLTESDSIALRKHIDENYAKGGKIKAPKVERTALDELKEYANALAPQRGMFSTLDELVQQAPFERGSAEQWRGYLKPGRMLKRDGLEFPLKKEELDYAQLERILQGSDPINPEGIMKPGLLEAIRNTRPGFNVSRGFEGVEESAPENVAKALAALGERAKGMPARYGPGGDPRLSHQSPGSTYEESVTRVPGLDYPGHFTPDTLVWSRTSQHALPTGEKMRLIEEIQSDLHQAAAEKLTDQYGGMDMLTPEELARHEQLSREMHEAGGMGNTPEYQATRERIMKELLALEAEGVKRIPRRGYRIPEDEAARRIEALTAEKNRIIANPDSFEGTKEERLSRLDEIDRELGPLADFRSDTPPDAPFKDPAEYARLELRKQLLNAANNDEDYLAMTRGSDQRERYGGAGEGTEYFYDTIYPAEMSKLAKQYGAEMVEVPLDTQSAKDVRIENLRNLGIETTRDLHDYFGSGEQLLEAGVRSGGVDVPLDTLESIARQLDPDNTTGWRNNAQYVRTNAVPEQMADPEYAPDIAQAWDDLVTHVSELMDQHKSEMSTATKTFPAIKLTPEVRERIKRIGTPLWSAGAGATGLELEQQDESGGGGGGGFAEGGDVSKDEPKPSRSSFLKDLQRIILGLSTQWAGLDPETGKAVAPFSYGEGEDLSQYPIDPETGMILAPMKFTKPGMIDELVSLPELLGLHSATSAAASERAQRLDEALRQQLDVSDPESWKDYALEAGGTMLGQLPVPGAVMRGPLSKLPGAAKVAGKALGPALEWFSPTIEPSLANYAIGTGAGTVLTKTLPQIFGGMQQAELPSEYGPDVENMLRAAYARRAREQATHYGPQGDEELEPEIPPENEEFINNFLPEGAQYGYQ